MHLEIKEYKRKDTMIVNTTDKLGLRYRRITSLPFVNDNWAKVKQQVKCAKHITTIVNKFHESDLTFPHDGSTVKGFVSLVILLSTKVYSNTTKRQRILKQ